MKEKLLFLIKFISSRFSTESKYKIVRGYNHRKKYSYFNDTSFTDDFQDEVYKAAHQYFVSNSLKTIVDVGCGSGYKLLKYFSEFQTIGIDVPETVQYLRTKYPDRTWLSVSEAKTAIKADMVICSDVIEHVLDPDELLATILSFQPSIVVISTPDRKLLDLSDYFGPPRNPTHIREWTFPEFDEYMSEKFESIDHFISNYYQRTQVMVCRPKELTEK